MKKTIWIAAGFILYATLISWYLFIGADTSIPVQYQGTEADPSVFMSERQLELSHDFSRIKQWLYFLSVPFEWMIYLVVLGIGLSKWFRNRAMEITRFSVIHNAVYVVLLSLIAFILSFPIDYYSYTVSLDYNISVQPFTSWMKDNIISFWINTLFLFVIVQVLYWLMKKSERRWWFYGWLLSIPFTLFIYFIQPIWIDPLYNDFYRLEDKMLEEKILALADKADIPADRVYEVNMSEKTNALNAYVNGIGSNLRIVLWDTTLKNLSDKEVLFVMAHEMGHFVKHHLVWNLVGSIVASFLGLWIGAKLYAAMIKRWGERWGVKKPTDIAALPALLLIFSLLSFAASPVENAISRQAERSADQYAIEMTQDPEAAVGSFQQLAVSGLSEVHPPFLVKLFLYGHPTMLERITYLDQWERTDPINSEAEKEKE
ncbi:M48 family metallopeptidase [Pseudalkalibacillus salsuginis]|uniref:M48 family metallopeptidase n=1 Tax=Pseudalkalibacillus salsuginis TaxID=2910972 RepID=UPI001F46C53B|nr:M48 family metallopeptidase [Pseudalkalibacillus salsuginis]MCF6411139.1 M48 family metallopeptidase [Pseudalkalibacillus salsuginis]